MAQARTRRRFTAEYKAEAVKRLEESGKSLQQVADELGIHANQLRGWRNEQRAVGSAELLAKQKAEAAERARLRREVKRLEQENGILKRAAAFFAGRRYRHEIPVRGRRAGKLPRATAVPGGRCRGERVLGLAATQAEPARAAGP
jgi:transposase